MDLEKNEILAMPYFRVFDSALNLDRHCKGVDVNSIKVCALNTNKMIVDTNIEYIISDGMLIPQNKKYDKFFIYAEKYVKCKVEEFNGNKIVHVLNN